MQDQMMAGLMPRSSNPDNLCAICLLMGYLAIVGINHKKSDKCMYFYIFVQFRQSISCRIGLRKLKFHHLCITFHLHWGACRQSCELLQTTVHYTPSHSPRMLGPTTSCRTNAARWFCRYCIWRVTDRSGLADMWS